MNISTASPAEIDGYIAKLNAEIAQQRGIMDRCRKRIQQQQEADRIGRILAVPVNELKMLAAIEAASLLIESIKAERSLFIDEWNRRGGWNRYFLVDSESGNGHVHYDDSHYRCSRTNTTAHYWLTEQSGLRAIDVVALAGERACTVCFPWAPVGALAGPTELFTPSEIVRQKAREAKAAAAAARNAKKITNPDGSPLHIGGRYGERITSVIGAERAAVDICVWARIYRRGLNAIEVDDLERLCVALAAKRHTSPAAELSALQARYEAKCKREGVTP